MSRSLAVGALLLSISVGFADDPTPLEKSLAVQKAMATARQYLDVNMPAEAVAALEAEVPHADGNKTFLNLLREAYLAELHQVEKAPKPDAARVAQLRRNLGLLGGTVPTSKPATHPAAGSAPHCRRRRSSRPRSGHGQRGRRRVQEGKLRRGRQAVRRCREPDRRPEGRVGVLPHQARGRPRERPELRCRRRQPPWPRMWPTR